MVSLRVVFECMFCGIEWKGFFNGKYYNATNALSSMKIQKYC